MLQAYLSIIEPYPTENREEVADGKGQDTVDSSPTSVEQMHATDNLQHMATTEDYLHCPKCRIGFPISDHEKLITHASDCISEFLFLPTELVWLT